MSLAEQYEINEQYEQAYEEYKKDLEKHPNDLSILERLGHLAMMLNKKEEAAEFYSRILEKDATNTLCYEQLMDIYADTDKYKYYIYRGNLHSIEHKLEHAINDYKKALSFAETDRDNVMTRYTLANFYEQSGNITKAIDELLKTLEYEDNHEEVFLKLADLYVKEDIISSAIDTLERAKKYFNTDTINENLAKLYLKNENAEKAKSITKDELLKIKCMLECNDAFEAEKELTKIEGKYNKNPEFYALKAQYYFITGDCENALETVNSYEKHGGNPALIYQMRALIFEQKQDDYNEHINWGKYNIVRGNKDVAINEFLNAFQLKNDDVDLMNTLAVLLEETGDNNHATEFWEKISYAEPNNKKALEKLADFRDSIGDYRTEADYLEKLHKLDSRNAIVVKRLAKIYEKLKNKPSAIEFYTKYINLAPTAEDAQLVTEKLKKLEHTDMHEEEGLLDKIMKLFNK